MARTLTLGALLSSTAGSLLFSGSATGHHSLSPYDRSEQIEIAGFVQELEWKNPHVYIHLDVIDSDGVSASWTVEAPHPGWMGRSGWSATTLEEGEAVTVVGNPGRDSNAHIMLGSLAKLSDNSELIIPQAGGRRPRAELEAVPTEASDGIAGRWLPNQTQELVSILMYPSAETLPLTPRGVESIESYTPAQNPAQYCEQEAAPLLMFFPFMHRIDVLDDRVVITTESYELERVVWLDRDSHTDAEPSRQGHSIGHWDDDTLVVDTQKFTDNRRGNGFLLESSTRKHLVERFEPSDDGTTLHYRFLLADPEFLTEPVEAEIVLSYRPDLPVVPDVECDVETAQRFLEAF